MPNRDALIIHYLACFRAGIVAVPLNYRYTPTQMDHALEACGARIILAHAERTEDIAATKIASRLPLGAISYGAPDKPLPSFEKLIGQDPPRIDLPEPDPESPAVIFFTSGSTGAPKGVTHSRRSVAWLFSIVTKAFEVTPNDIVLPGSSLSHIGGFVFTFMALAGGARAVVAANFEPDEVLPLLRQERPTVLCMLPAALFHLLRDGHAVAEDFSSLRLLRSGADKVPAELEHEFTTLTGRQIDEGYGSSETGLVTLNPPSGMILDGSVGLTLPAITVEVRDDDGAEVPAAADGNLWIKGPNLMMGYWNDSEQTNAAFRDGWFDSGDRMSADERGYLWFRGRKKQIIVHDASNIYPQEVEEALLGHPSVESVGVIGIHDLIHGENVRAYVVIKDGVERPSRQELIRFAQDLIGYRAPEEIEFLAEMPLNATGKVDRVRLKDMAAERHSCSQR
jgi:long-chain acyl-CoA synthetase